MSGVEYPRIVSASDSAILVEVGDGISEDVNREVYRIRDAIEASDVSEYIVEMIPAYRTLLVEYVATEVSDADMRAELEQPINEISVDAGGTDIDSSGRTVEVPVVYGGEFGPDLSDVAAHAGLSEDQVIDIHSSATYRVYMVGFAPGFPYLGGMDARIACPRLTTPRVRIPAGSVGIAESQTGIYPNESAGGWRIIGRSPKKLFDVDMEPPSVLEPGAMVKFVQVDSAELPDIGESEVEK